MRDVRRSRLVGPCHTRRTLAHRAVGGRAPTPAHTHTGWLQRNEHNRQHIYTSQTKSASLSSFSKRTTRGLADLSSCPPLLCRPTLPVARTRVGTRCIDGDGCERRQQNEQQQEGCTESRAAGSWSGRHLSIFLVRLLDLGQKAKSIRQGSAPSTPLAWSQTRDLSCSDPANQRRGNFRPAFCIWDQHSEFG